MADEIIIETTSAEVIEVGVVGPQGPQGPKGDPGDVAGLPLSAQGDTLYRGASQNERLAIGQNSQVLKVVNGLPAWANESGAVSSVNGETGAVVLDATDVGAAATTHATEHEAGEADEIQAMAALVETDYLPLNGVYFHDGTTTSGRPNFFKTGTRKNTKIVYNNATNQWNLVRNLTVEAVGVDGPETVPWGNTWEDFTTPEFVNVTRLGLEDMVQKLAETGSAATATTSQDGLISAADQQKLNGIASGAEVNVQANWTEADSGSDAFIQNKPSTFAPSAHAASHASTGSDPLAPSDIGAQSLFTTTTLSITADTNLSAARATIYNVSVGSAGSWRIIPATTGSIAGDVIIVFHQPIGSGNALTFTNGLSPSGIQTIAQNERYRFVYSGTVWQVDPVYTHTHAASAITSGTLDISRIPTGTTSSTVCIGNDARLSDSRTPTAHAASHAAGGSDPLAPSDIGAQSIFVTQTITSGQTLTAQRARIYEVMNFGSAYTITMPSTDNIAGDTIVFRSVNVINNAVTISNPLGTGSSLTALGQQFRYIYSTVGGGSWQLVPVDTHTHAASAVTSGTLAHERGGLEADVSAYNGLVKISGGSTSAVTVTSAGEALLDDADAAAQRTTLGLGTAATAATGDFAAASHTHELTALAATGATNGHVLTANGSNGVTFAALPASGVTGAAASASDVLGVSGANITGVDANADRIVFWDDSASALKYLEAGSGLSISGTTLTATASGGSKTYAVFNATDNQPPATAFATYDTRSSIAVLDFDDATDESAVFVSIIPEGASLGSGLKIRLHWMATTATSGNVVWDVSLERMTTDLDADSFDTIASGTAAANGTSGILTVTEITLTTIDSVTAGDAFRLKVTRDANNASDTMTGDAELVVCEVRSAA